MRILSNLSVSGLLGLNSVADANTDTDKFLVLDSSGIVRYRTGAEVFSDIGAGGAAAYTSVLQHTVKAGEALTKGQAVYVTGADGTNMIVGKASNATEATSSKTLGLIAQNLATNDQGFVVTEGLLAGIDTSTAQAGDPVWLGTNGNLIFGLANKPYAPTHMVFIGIVTRAQQNNGEIFVKVQNGFELQELHNVQITSTPADNTVLAYETSTSLYKMKSIPTLLGYTPVTNARSITINGTTYDLSADRSWSVGTHTGNLTTGYVPKATGATTLTDSLIYDNGSGIGINTSSPYESSAFKLDVNGGLLIKNTSGTTAQLILINSNPATGGNNGFVQLSAGGNTETAFGQWQTYYGMSVASGALRLQPAGGQVLIGTTTTSAFLTDINGTLRVSGQLTLGSTISNNTYVYTMPGASGTLALVSQIPSLSGYLTIASADATYLTQSSAASIYLSQTSASNTYLTISGAASTYLSQASASNTYLTISGASSIYLSQTSASNTYLTINGASITYLSQTSASNTYLTINNAASTYVSLTGSYANPSWITSLAWSKITGAPAFLTSYTETDTLATVTARGASTTTRTTFTEVGATRAGSDTVAVGPWFRWTNVAEDRQMLVQLNASNGLTYWAYNGSAWATALVLTQAGAATFSSSVSATGASIGRVVMDYDGTDSWFRMQSGNRMRITTTGGTDFIIPNTGNMTYNGNTVWHAGNLTNLNQLSNGPGYITGITSANVTGALGYTPYNSSNPAGYITASALSAYAPNNASFSDANALTTGGFFTAYNASNVPSGLSSLDMGILNIPLWGSNSGGERYTMQLFANLDTNTNFFIRKFKYFGAVNQSDWYTLIHSGNYSSYRGNQLVSPNGGTVVAADSAMPDSGHSFIHTLALGPSGNDGHILGMTWAGTTTVYGAQIWVDTDPNNRMAFRSRSSSGVWTGWNEVIHSSNYNGYSPTLTGGGASGTWGISISGVASQVSINYNNDSNANYQLLWGSGNSVYGTGSVYVNPSTDTVYANYFSSAYYMDVYTSAGGDYLRITDNQVYRPNGGILYLNWSSNANVALTGPSGGNVGVGNNSPSYKMHVSGDIYANGGWLRVSGTSGLYFESYGGGWHMNDSTWIRSYNSKNVYMSADVRTGGQFQLENGSSYWARYGTYSGSLHRIAYMSFDWDSNYNAYANHGIASTDIDGSFSDSMSINSYNDITLRLDSNDNNGNSYLRISNNTTGSGTIAWIGYESGMNQNYFSGSVGISAGPRTDGYRLNMGGSIHLNGNSVDYVGSIYMNGGVYIQTNNNRNLLVKSSGAADCGILGRGNGDQFAFQLYGNGSGSYGFLDGVWAAWDLRKAVDGSLYMNDNDSYYLNTTSNSYVYRLESATDLRAPYFYDSNDTGYYFKGNGISRMYGVAIRGDASSTDTSNQIFFWGSSNSTTSAIGFKANGGAFPNPTGFGDGYNTYLTMDSDGRGWVFRRGVGGSDFSAAYTSGWILNNGVWQANASMRAPIFYDSNDTSFYLDPNSASNLQNITWETSARIGRPYYWTNRYNSYTTTQFHNTGTNGWGTSEGTWANAWKGGFSGWDIWGYSTDHPQGGGYIHAQGIISGQHYATSDGSAAYGWMMVGAHNATENRYWLRGKWDTSTSGWTEMMTSGNNPYAWNMNQYVRTSDNVEFNQVSVRGGLYVGTWGNSSDIYMTDGDEGTRRIHCNSNRVGFLDQSNGWGAYCDDSGNWTASGDVTAYSDARIKTNVKTVENALEKTLQMRGVTYNRTDSKDTSTKVGVIAQEVMEVLPEVVHEQADGLLGVSYGNIVGVLIEAVKEQQKQIEELKGQLNGITK